MDKNNVQFWELPTKPLKKTQKHTSEHNVHNSVFQRIGLLAYFFNKIIFSLQNNLGIFVLVSYILKMANKIMPTNAKLYYCNICDFKCSKNSNYMQHLMTRKHNILINTNNNMPKNAAGFTCDCGKVYKHASSLCKHKHKCKLLGSNETTQPSKLHENLVVDKELVMNVLKQNTDLQKQLMETQNQVLETQNQVMELLKKGTHNTTNSHNKTFNLNFFLNETCKNAMNIMDFVNNLQLQLSDLERMEDIGYVNGMSNIIIKNLKDMDVTERPVHCTDAKREVLYVKDEDKWDKETSDKPKIRKAIKHVAHKNARLLQEFKEKHPDCTKSESKHSDTYTKLMVEAMGGKGCNDVE